MKIIVLDRDGVINEDSRDFIKNLGEWHAISGSLEAITKLNQAGYKVVVATNQSGIARGLLTLADLDAIHNKMIQQLGQVGGHLDGIFVCPHGPHEGCNCRKPKPGLLFEIAKQFAVLPAQMLVIGDSLRDLLSAKVAGCPAVLVRTGNGLATLVSKDKVLDGVPVYDNLAMVAENIGTLASGFKFFIGAKTKEIHA